ncbi:tetratricopeptide repeat protein [Marinilabilia salmonicolor]|jgi:tetratricopeptide (TPR) repeat protein|uniref:Tetratricopeptide repeat protein n=1 Tax=Marinilabilia salmonicolor TaxID=989 RepID=A0A2T0XTK4_9BACT|nr:tetratricopeptide repeat protein [Marinilabilia salmonicolor]PRZ02279.1 tetratricopeptide repeat protein [Marinilabilia salmonicolor]RCW30623.1 tetratricopeptide repeat protein [Marinilabilia salmonicolor]
METPVHKQLMKVYRLLEVKRVKESLDVLGDLVKETHNSDLIDGLYNLEMTYKSLLRYTVEGFSDPERQKVYNQLLVDIYSIADQIVDELRSKTGQGWLFDARRYLKSKSDEELTGIMDDYLKAADQYLVAYTVDSEIPLSYELEKSQDRLFEMIASLPGFAQSRQEQVREVFFGEDFFWPWQSVMVSALTLNLLTTFRRENLDLLFQLCEHPHKQVKLRAFTGLLFVLYEYDTRLSITPGMKEKISRLNELFSVETIQSILIQIIRTRETEKLTKKMHEEILPEVARIQPNLRRKLDLDNLLNDALSEDKNPDWEDVFSDSPELMNKLEELSHMQMEGADLFMSTFKMLKHFPFFNDLHHWFLPFFYPNPIVKDALRNETGPLNNEQMLQSMADSGVMCNSDKYSLVMSIPQMPGMQKEMMGKMFGSELEAMREVQQSDELVDPGKKELFISNQYIQDLYRFFKLHPQKASFDDPFSWEMAFHKKWFLPLLTPGENTSLKLGEYLFGKNYFREATGVYEQEAKKEMPERQILQKLAYCYQQNDDYEKALHYYQQADLYGDSQVWNLKKIALCYRYLKNPEKALEYYKAAEQLKPDDLHTQVSVGHCLLELKRFDEALQYYFKVEYLAPDNHKVWRPIAWCSLVEGKLDQALKYGEKPIEEDPTQHDFMNMGHIYWCRGDRKTALEWYLKSVKHQEWSLKDFVQAFVEDRHILMKHGVNPDDIPIMLDQLRYYLVN